MARKRAFASAALGVIIVAAFIVVGSGVDRPATAQTCVRIPSGGNIAGAVASNPAGTTFCLSGSYSLARPVAPRERQVFRGPASIVGVNGNGTGFLVSQVGVQFHALNMSGFTERAIRCSYRTQIFGGRYHHNGVNGIGCGLGRDARGGVVIAGVEVDHNGSQRFTFHSSAGIKILGSIGSVVRSSYIHDNIGNGIWFDNDSGGSPGDVISNNRIERNSMRGIMYEVSRGHVAISGNTVTGNNTARVPGAAGIGISSSKNVTVWANTVRGNQMWAIRANDIDRGYNLENIDIYNNAVSGAFYGCHYVGVRCHGRE